MSGSQHVAPLAAEDFKSVFRRYPAGTAVVTADDGTRPVAMTISSLFSVSASPPIFGFAASASSSSSAVLQSANTVVVHLLTGGHLALAQLCATRGADRFGTAVEWERLPTGEPFYPSVPTRVRGRIIDRVAAGDSTIVVVEAVDASFEIDEIVAADKEVRPLVYCDRSWHGLSHLSEIWDGRT